MSKTSWKYGEVDSLTKYFQILGRPDSDQDTALWNTNRRTFQRIMNSKNPSPSPVTICRSQEKLRDASSVIRKHLSDIAFIRDGRRDNTIEGEEGPDLDMEALMEVLNLSSPNGRDLSQFSSAQLWEMWRSGSEAEISGLSGLSSPLQVVWRSDSEAEASPAQNEAQTQSPEGNLSQLLLRMSFQDSKSNDSQDDTSITSAFEVSYSSKKELGDAEEGYDADISSN